MTGEIRAGLRYVRGHAWLWATLVTAAVAYLLFMGPTEVLLPFIVKNRLAGGAGDLGLVFAAGGLGSLACALAIGQLGLPRRSLTFMYLAWTVATAGGGRLRTRRRLGRPDGRERPVQHARDGGNDRLGDGQAAPRPASLLGRVSSLDWLISIGLLPLSYALTGPVSAAIGVPDHDDRGRRARRAGHVRPAADPERSPDG